MIKSSKQQNTMAGKKSADIGGNLKTHGYSKIITELKRVCNIAFDKDFIDTHSGNISVGTGDDILITKTGRSLIDLKLQDFTIVPLNKPEKNNDNDPSSEIDIHRFILKSFPNSTVLHSHPINAVSLSLHMDYGQTVPNINIKKPDINARNINKIKELYAKYNGMDEITALDFESAYFFPKIYVFPLDFIEDIKADRLKIKLEASDIFKENGVFMIKSHGSFSWGKTPLDALRWTIMLESTAKIILSF